jgi:hypothetical protein
MSVTDRNCWLDVAVLLAAEFKGFDPFDLFCVIFGVFRIPPDILDPFCSKFD